MAETKRKRYEKVVGPKGVAVWPHLTKPDFKWKKEVGEFHTKLRVHRDKVTELIAKMEKARDAVVAEAAAQTKETLGELKGKKLAEAKKFLAGLESGEVVNALPISPVYDDNGDETDEVEISYKRTASYKDRKTGEMRKSHVILVDAKGKEIKKKISIWGGSTIEVSASIIPYNTPLGVGVRLSLDGVRLIVLQSGGQSASSLGFKVDDEDAADGYSVDDDADDDDADADYGDGGEGGASDGAGSEDEVDF